MRHFLRCFALLFITAATHAATPFDNYLEDGTFLVASLDLDETTSTESAQWLIATIEAAAPALRSGDATMPAMITRQAISQLRELRDFGVKEIGLVVAIEDLTMNHGPLLVTKLPDEAAAMKVRDWLQPRLQMTPGFEARLSGSTLLVATTATLDRYAKLTPAARPDLADAHSSANAALSAVLSPGADARRVLRELWPMLPPPYDKLTGPLVADDVRSVTATVQLGAAPIASLTITSPNPSARESIAQAISAGLQTGVVWVETNQPPYAAGAKETAELLAPRVDDAAVTMRIDSADAAVRQFATNVLAPAIVVAQERAKRSSKMNDMKQIILAMHNYHDVRGSLPTNVVDKDGKPLLSWRVLLLPFLEQETFLKELHLDESWDSPHNLEVAKRSAPQVYCRDNREGLTSFLRPVYAGSDLAAARGDIEPIEKPTSGRMCFLQPSETFRDITDGLSKTIMVAEVAPEHAVFWTKPDDWEVDLEDPLAKLRTDKREGFVTGYYDGSARFEPFDIDPGLLKKMITKNGGEAISR
ncbi:DUF1559 domain-containing protein [Botrimarina mediterranea]|uniref:DUF1559 family PulG-like putative transporter n=1 Tax=Botrimarina mediterranea TaxID=2528022 RepID=UPI00118A64C6|nr:hypothetical protein K2D_08040 [Planctomycetes bacterium K2D]